jgi:hypothetical protein
MRQKKGMSKDEKIEQAKKLAERRERDQKMDYKYTSCPFCGEATRWRGKVQPLCCGREECCKAMLADKLRVRNGNENL